MFKRLTVLLLMLVVVACGKKSLQDNLGGGTDPNALTKYPEYRYMQMMYHPASGKTINDAVLSNDIYKIYYSEIQKILNINMKFPLPGQSAKFFRDGEITNWYETLPSNYDLSKNNGDISLAIQNYLKTPEGQAVIVAYLQQINSNLDNINSITQENNPGQPNPQVESSISQIIAVAQIGANLGLCIASNNYVGAALATFDLVGGLFGGSDGNSAITDQLNNINHKLDEIQATLDQIEAKLNKLETKLDGIWTSIAYEDVKNARSYLKTLAIQLKSTDQQAIYNHIKENIVNNNSFNYQNSFEKAFNAAKNVIDINRNNAPYIDIPGVRVAHFTNTGYPYLEYVKSFQYQVKSSLKYMPMALEDIDLMKRLSLTRLAVLSKIYSGKKLLDERKHFIDDQDKDFINQLKTALAKISQIIESNYTPLNFNDVNFNGDINNMYCLIDENVGYKCNTRLMSDGKTIIPAEGHYIFMNPGYSGLADYYSVWCDFNNNQMKLMPGNLTNEIIRKSIINSALSKTEIRNYLITALAILAEWEIQLQAHLEAAR